MDIKNSNDTQEQKIEKESPEEQEKYKLDKMIPFACRKGELLSISFRSFDLKMGKFKLKIEIDGTPDYNTELLEIKNTVLSELSEMAMIPTFKLNHKNKILKFLNHTTYAKYIIFLLDNSNNELLKFKINLSQLSFLGKELYSITIYHYPIIIFEFTTGYYTTYELNKINEKIISDKENNDKKYNEGDWVILDKKIKFPDFDNPNKYPKKSRNIIRSKDKIKKKDNFSKTVMFSKDSNDPSEKKNNTTINKKTKKLHRGTVSKKKSKLENDNDKYANYKTEYPMKVNNKDARRAISNLSNDYIVLKNNDNISIKTYLKEYNEKICMILNLVKRENDVSNSNNLLSDNYNNYFEDVKRKLRIMQINNEIALYKRKNEEMNIIRNKLTKIIINKTNLLNDTKELIKEKQNNYIEKNNYFKNISLDIGKYKLLHESLLNKKIIEICFVFFNSKMSNLFLLPNFSKTSLKKDTNDTIKKRFEYYNSNKKKISASMGYICQLMIYMSKIFNINLRFPLLLKGSKSFIIKGKKEKEKDSLPLHLDIKKDDKYGNFENALSYLSENMREIINYLGGYHEIVSEEKHKEVNEAGCSGEYLFFYYFITFNNCICDFFEKVQLMFQKQENDNFSE